MAAIGAALSGGISLASIGTLVNTFGQISSLASGSNTTIVSYTVPAGKTFFLQHCEVSGENIAVYTVEVASIVQALKRTYWGGSFNEEFKFDDENARGLSVSSSGVVTVKVIHQSATTGDFDARILGVEV